MGLLITGIGNQIAERDLFNIDIVSFIDNLDLTDAFMYGKNYVEPEPEPEPEPQSEPEPEESEPEPEEKVYKRTEKEKADLMNEVMQKWVKEYKEQFLEIPF